jgi:hypothetical protein
MKRRGKGKQKNYEPRAVTYSPPNAVAMNRRNNNITIASV